MGDRRGLRLDLTLASACGRTDGGGQREDLRGRAGDDLSGRAGGAWRAAWGGETRAAGAATRSDRGWMDEEGSWGST